MPLQLLTMEAGMRQRPDAATAAHHRFVFLKLSPSGEKGHDMKMLGIVQI
jgi:hypothetical protein